MTLADDPPNGNIPRRDDRASHVSPPDPMEAKRLEARRRFLLGGAAALPVILHVTATSAAEGGSGFCSPLGGTRRLVDGSTTLYVCNDES